MSKQHKHWKIRVALHNATLELIERLDFLNVTCIAVCQEAGISLGSFRYYSGGSWLEWIDAYMVPDTDFPPGPVAVDILPPKYRKYQLVATAREIGKNKGILAITTGVVARAAGVSPALARRYFNAESLRAAVVEWEQRRPHSGKRVRGQRGARPFGVKTGRDRLAWALQRDPAPPLRP
ncbi:hypothetical protein [Candidatus Rariloculus sp.]|uniref:hypothetical protein n=1 Tax=Candidatus Rariloculus sp. TaxID=3101265 RepID=UPI003D0B73B1